MAVKKLYILFLLLIFLPVRLRNITSPLMNITSFRQAQTATVALNFYKEGINPFKSQLDIFGMGKEKYLTLEFPLYQMIVAVLYRLFGVSDIWGRLVSVVFGFIGSIYLYLIVIALLKNTRLAVLAVFFFLSAPLNMFTHRDFLIESAVVAFLLAAFYYSICWLNNPRVIYFFLSVVFYSLGFVQKIIYGPFLFLPLFWLNFRNSKKLISVKLIWIILIPGLIYFVWQRYADMINLANNHSYFSSSNPEFILWNTGNFTDRLSLYSWQFRLQNLLNGIFLKPGLILFLIGIISYAHISSWRIFYIWLLAEILYFLIFFRIQSHIYYQMIITPVTVLFIAGGLIRLGKIMNPIKIKNLNLLFISVFASLYFFRSITSSDWDASLDKQWYNRILKVGESVRGEKYGLLVNPGYDWNSVYTYYPRLKLLSISAEDLTPMNLSKWQKKGYTYIILHRYRDYSEFLSSLHSGISLEFIESYPKILELEDFQVRLIYAENI